MDEKRLNETESIELIASMISRTKERIVKGGGNIFLMWGYLVVGVSILVWTLLLLTSHPAMNWFWFLIWIIGGTATPIMMRKKRAEIGAKSYSDKISSQIWSAVGFCAIFATFCCLGFLLAKGIDCWGMMLVFALIIVPFAEIAQGVIIREKSLIAGGAIGIAVGIFTTCCIISRIELYVNWYMPLFIIAYICMMIIPGHIMNHKAKQQSL